MLRILWRLFNRITKETAASIVQPNATPKAATQIIQYDGFSIALPEGHLLPHYQRQHPHYDRFLPYLSERLPPSSTVVDVGANCGDTLAAMIDKNYYLNFICIEPDDEFYEFLLKNANSIRAHIKSKNIRTVRAFVGKAVSNVALEGVGGTKRAALRQCRAGELAQISRTLDNILQDLGERDVRLIKSDVDGFDYDVLDSADDTLAQTHPILFFECQIDNEMQKAAYRKTISALFSKGYLHWTIFDNFGSLILRSSQAEQIDQIIDYIWRQNSGRSTRTFYYVDLLACVTEDSKFLETVVDDYSALG